MEFTMEKMSAASLPEHDKENHEMTRDQYSRAYTKSYPSTVRFLVSRGLSGESAEEAAQAAWAKGWEHRANLRNPSRVASWVNTIALNLFRNWFRRRESPEELPEIPTAPRIDARAIDLHRTLDRCAPRDCELLVGHYLEGYTSEELGERTGCTAVAVRVRLLRVRRRLGDALRPGRKGRSGSRRTYGNAEQLSPTARSRSGKPAIATTLPATGLKKAA
jgi:RNA polymerase sigma factor (sigma-70 family)